MAQDQQVGQSTCRASRLGDRRRVQTATRHGVGRVACGERGGDPQRFVILGRCAGRPRHIAPCVPAHPDGAREHGHASGIESSQPAEQRPDHHPIRTVPRLADGRLPAARQTFPGPIAERLAEQFVEERTQDQFRTVPLDRLAHGLLARRHGVEPGMDGPFHGCQRRQPVRRQEPGDRRPEGDRCRFGAGKAVDLIRLQGGDALQEPSQCLSGIDRPMSNGPGCRPVIAPGCSANIAPGLAWSDAMADTAQAVLAVVAGSQGRIAQPVVRDVDPLGGVQPSRAGDVRVISAQERPPGHFDDLRARVSGDLEASIQIVGGEREAWWHVQMLMVGATAAR